MNTPASDLLGPVDAGALSQVTALLHQIAERHPAALPSLMELVQGELRGIAHSERLALRAGDTLSTTALVNEAYLKLRQGSLPTFADRRHFYALAARAMRQILTDYARIRLAQKRGGGVPPAQIDTQVPLADDPAEAARVLELNDALDRLEAVRPRLAHVVYLRFYAGLDDREIGTLLDIEESTVRRDWIKARGWLYRHLHPDTA